MRSLFTRLLQGRGSAEHLRFTVYTRAGCHCCHKALDLLKEYQSRYKFPLEEIDIDADPDLRTRYDTEVPVVAVNGKVRFRGTVERVLLERLIVAESRNQNAGA
jgi:glutaredoxin